MLSRVIAQSSTPILARAAAQAATSGGALSVLALRAPLAGITPQRRTFVRVVNQGHEAFRTTFGRNPVRLEPGLRMKLPIIHTLAIVDMREQSVSVEGLLSFTQDNVPVRITGSLFYQIVDGYASQFKVSDVHQQVKSLGTSAVRSAVGRFSYDEIISDRNRINQELRSIIARGVDNWVRRALKSTDAQGVDCTRFEIQQFSPSNRDVERQLELQMEAERSRRKQILDTQASVNVAEGAKAAEVLRAEGHAAAILREAEARKSEASLFAEGLAEQIKAVSTELDGDKKSAVDLLIQLQHVRSLQSIAAGKSNSTYFLPSLNTPAGQQSFNVDVLEQLKRRPPVTVQQAPQPAVWQD